MNDEPKLMNGSGIPVIGISPTVIPMLMRIWNVHMLMTPATMREPIRSRRRRRYLKRHHQEREVEPEQDHHPDEPELLAENGEDEVRVALGQEVQVGLRARTETLARELARADRDLGLRKVVARPPRIARPGR